MQAVYIPPVVWNSGEAVAGIGRENEMRSLSRQNEWKSECVFRETRAMCCRVLNAIVSSTFSQLSRKMEIYFGTLH